MLHTKAVTIIELKLSGRLVIRFFAFINYIVDHYNCQDLKYSCQYLNALDLKYIYNLRNKKLIHNLPQN